MDYKIFQIKDIESVNYAFMDYEFALKNDFSMKDYEEVVHGEIDYKGEGDYEALEMLYTKYNLYEHPNSMHSLSVSDIIQFGNGDTYYVNGCGFKKIK